MKRRVLFHSNTIVPSVRIDLLEVDRTSSVDVTTRGAFVDEEIGEKAGLRLAALSSKSSGDRGVRNKAGFFAGLSFKLTIDAPSRIICIRPFSYYLSHTVFTTLSRDFYASHAAVSLTVFL